MKITKIFAFALCSACLFAACGDDDEVSNFVNETLNGDEAINNDALTPDQQQTRLQEVGKEVLNLVDAKDFTYWRDLANHVNKCYVDNDNFANDSVEEWFDEIAEIALLNNGKDRVETESFEWGNYITRYKDYEKLYKLANIKGKFTAEDEGWKKEKSDNLQFIITDHNNQTVTATLTTTGNGKKVHIVDVEDWLYGNETYDGETGKYTYTNNYDYNNVYVEIPEKITVTIAEGKKTRLQIEVTTALDNISDNIDIKKVTLVASSKVVLDSYVFETSNISYKHNNTATASFSVMKSGVPICSGSANLGNWNLTGVGSDIADEDNWDDMDFSGGAGNIRLDIMNKIQFNVAITDAGKFIDAVEKADDCSEGTDPDGKDFKKAVKDMNKFIKSGIYFDGKRAKQSAISFEPFEDGKWESYWDNTTYYYWEVHPVLEFNDGTKYSLFEESDFFNRKAFKALVDLFENLCDDFEDLVDDLDF